MVEKFQTLSDKAAVSALLNDEAQLNELAATLFRQADTDGNGSIDQAEFNAVMNIINQELKKVGYRAPEKLEQEDTDEGFKNLFDADHNGALSLTEFHDGLIKILQYVQTLKK